MYFPRLSAELKQTFDLGSSALVCSVYESLAFSLISDTIQGFGLIPLLTGNLRRLRISRRSVTPGSSSLES